MEETVPGFPVFLVWRTAATSTAAAKHCCQALLAGCTARPCVGGPVWRDRWPSGRDMVLGRGGWEDGWGGHQHHTNHRHDTWPSVYAIALTPDPRLRTASLEADNWKAR